MFTNVTLSTSNWLQHKDHGSSIYTRPVLDSFSFGSRCLFVSLSKTERGPNEGQAKNERKSNECRSRK